jgi:diadenylate cyclase
VSIINNLIDTLLFIFERLNWLGVIDLALVTLIFYSILLILRDTQAMALLRGVLLLVVLLSLLTSLKVFPAFSWLVKTILPALVVVVPVIFAPEIRRALERLGRAGNIRPNMATLLTIQNAITAIVSASVRLSDRQHGALIIIQRLDSLDEYIRSGITLDAQVTTALLMQIFFPSTPLHDGAAIISGTRVVAASCVMPLSASGVLTRSSERQMGLRHRAALGISEVSDAIAIVVSEETGLISVAHSGRMIRRLDAERLENILRAFLGPSGYPRGLDGLIMRLFPNLKPTPREKNK